MSLSKPSSPVGELWTDYLRELEEKPVQTKALTAAVLSVVSDVLAQTMGGTPLSQINFTSIRNQFLIGLIIRGPMVHYWYVFLESLFQKLGYGSPKSANSTPVVLGKVALDQLTFGPFFNLLYFYVIGFAEGRSSAAIQAKISQDFIPVMVMNYKVWPLINILNFKYVPANLRVLFGNVISIFWMVYVLKLTKAK